MIPRARFVIVIAVLLALTVPAVALEGDNVSICGQIKAFIAATATTNGSVTIGARTSVLKSDDLYSRSGQNVEMLRVGRSICLQGSLNAAGEFVQYIAIAMPSPYCGTVLSFTAPTGTTAGSVSLRDAGVATLPLPSETQVGTVALGNRTCFLIGLNAAGDAVVTGRELTLIERAVASIVFCGRVDAWTKPTPIGPGVSRHEQAGSITIAGRVFPIAAGTTYQHPTPAAVGEATCLDGWFDSSGALIQYATPAGLPRCFGGQIRRYEPATATQPGILQLGGTTGTPPPTADSMLFPIRAATVLPADVLTWHYCFFLSLDATGRATVTGAEYGGTATRPPGQLPSTSTR